MSFKVAINGCYGGFSISNKAVKMLREFKGEDHNGYVSNRPQDRHDPDLIRVVETLGKGANGISADIEIVEPAAASD